jgi:dTDP-4-dehydrorhamnose reductase
MSVVITGANGTVGSALKQHLDGKGIEAISWDRKLIPIDNYQVMEDFLRHTKPSILFHLAIASNSNNHDEEWLVNYEWTSELAWITKILNIRFIYASTARVFSKRAKGPFTTQSATDAGIDELYGHIKRMSEERVLQQNPDSIIIRLGWQIGKQAGSNNMIDYFERHMRQYGQIKASKRWLPACSFLSDTVKLKQEISEMHPGIYMIDSNKKWSFYEIACALNKLHGGKWTVVPTDDFIYDQRLIDDAVNAPPLSDRLQTLS